MTQHGTRAGLESKGLFGTAADRIILTGSRHACGSVRSIALIKSRGRRLAIAQTTEACAGLSPRFPGHRLPEGQMYQPASPVPSGPAGPRSC